MNSTGKVYLVTNCETPYKIKVSPQQKVFKTVKIKSSINFDANRKAMKNLTTNAFTLYMYMLINNGDRVWALSSKDVYDNTALKQSTYKSAVKELIDKGYLVPHSIDIGSATFTGNAYYLYESLEIVETDPIQEPIREITYSYVPPLIGGQVTLSEEVF